MLTMILSVLSNFQYLLVVWYIIGIDHKKFSPFVIHVAHVRQEEHRLQSKFPRCPLYDLYRISDYLDSLPLIDIAIHSYHNNNNSDHLIRYGRCSERDLMPYCNYYEEVWPQAYHDIIIMLLWLISSCSLSICIVCYH